MRKAKPKKRYHQPDPRYSDPQVTLFVHNLMLNGKKSIAYRMFYDAMELIEKRSSQDGYETWQKALTNVTPGVEVRSRRVGGSTFQIPTEVRQERRTSLAMKWIISYSKKRSGRSMADKLAAELVAAAKGEGAAYKKKEDTHRMAEANKAFAHFRV